MKTRSGWTPIVLCAAILTAACGADNKTATEPIATGPGIHMAINGETWTGDTTTYTVSTTAPGYFEIVGQAASASSPTLAIIIYNADKPGTYQFGVGSQAIGAEGRLYNPQGLNLLTPQSGNAGTLVVMSISSTRIAGTFQFAAAPAFQTNGGAGAVWAAVGNFDLPITAGTVTALPPGAGSTIVANINGTTPYNAALISGALAGSVSPVTYVDGRTDAYEIRLQLPVEPIVGTYTLGSNPETQITVDAPQSGQPGGHWASYSSGSGTITVSSISGDRITGTFSAVCGATAASTVPKANVSVTGSFDIGLHPVVH